MNHFELNSPLAHESQDILTWSEFDLHLLVACFLRVRFPIMVALNKADTLESAEHISRVQAQDAVLILCLYLMLCIYRC